MAPAPLTGITIVARGSSDNAAVYGRYLLEAATGKPISLAAPSLHTLYDVDVDYRGQLVIAVSQSGATPEIVQTLQALQQGGGRGLAITNDPDSPLAHAAGETVALEMGVERAVPATKTVTGQLTAFAIIASALGRVPFTREQLVAVPDRVQAVLDDPDPVAAAAEHLAGASQLIVVARGYLFAAALETRAQDQGDVLSARRRLLGRGSSPRADRGGHPRSSRDRAVRRRSGPCRRRVARRGDASAAGERARRR